MASARSSSRRAAGPPPLNRCGSVAAHRTARRRSLCPSIPTPQHPNTQQTPTTRSQHHDQPTDRPTIGQARLHPIDWIDRDPTHQCCRSSIMPPRLLQQGEAHSPRRPGAQLCVDTRAASSSSVSDRLVVSSHKSMMHARACVAGCACVGMCVGCVSINYRMGGMLIGRKGARAEPTQIRGSICPTSRTRKGRPRSRPRRSEATHPPPPMPATGFNQSVATVGVQGVSEAVGSVS